MSGHNHAHADHGHGPDTHVGGPAGHSSRRSYLIGFVASVVLTAIPFWLVMARPIADVQAIALLVILFALVQIVVHTVFFLHVDTRSEGGWTLMSLAFTLVVVGIMIGGSVWVMYHLNTNMMPMSAADMSGMP